MSYYFFFFQAEDGIRGDLVTGVQTCALPILNRWRDINSTKYNKFQIKEVSSGNSVTNHVCSCKSNGSVPHSNRNGGSGLANHNLTAPITDISPDMSPLHLHQNLETDVREIKRYIKTIIYKQKHKEMVDKIKAEWRAVALVLDRMFFVLYVLSIIVSLATMFPRSA